MYRQYLLDFVHPRHRLLLATARRDGRPQISPVSGGVDSEGRIVISTYPARAKTRNAEQDARVSVLVLSDDWNGPWVQVDGDAEVLHMPEAADGLVTDIVTERGADGVAAIKNLTGGLGAHSVIEAVGTQESMMQAIHSTWAGGHVGYVGVTHEVALPGMELFFSHVHLHGGPAPVRRFLPDLMDRVWTGNIQPGKVFDLELPLDEAADGYKAMDERRAIKVLLRP